MSERHRESNKRGQMRRPSTSPKHLAEEERGADAYRLRVLGHTFREIAHTLGMSVAGAYSAFQRGRGLVIRDTVDEVLELHLERGQLMRKGLMPAAVNGDVQAIAAVMKIDEIERKLLGWEGQAANENRDPASDAKATLQAKLDQALARFKSRTEPGNDDGSVH
jgi:hypothetical protein